MVLAFSCWKYGLNPANLITGHHILDPARKTDPMNAFKILDKTFDQFVHDVKDGHNECVEEDARGRNIFNTRKIGVDVYPNPPLALIGRLFFVSEMTAIV